MFKCRSVKRDDRGIDNFLHKAEEALNNPPAGYEVDSYQWMQESQTYTQSLRIVYKLIPPRVVDTTGRKFKETGDK